VLFDKIGQGGMASIYLGRAETDLGGERLLVVKQILPLLSSSSEFSQLFIDEAKLSARLAHGNIVQVIDLGREDSRLYIAMEYVEGFDLRELLRQCAKRTVPLPLEFTLLIIVEVLRALDYAHRKRDDSGAPLGIVHRDVSPSNVLLSLEGEVKLCDFGIARAMGADSELPEAAIRGKAAYMSPEAAGGEVLDARSDVFSTGIVLWELLAGRRLYRPREGRTISLEQARRAELPELPDVGYPQQERLYDIVQRALAKRREDRFASARDMLRDLEAYVASAKLMASPLRFGEWLTTHFGQQIVAIRRQRELLAKNANLEPHWKPETRALSSELPAGSWSEPRVEIPPLPAPPQSLSPLLDARQPPRLQAAPAPARGWASLSQRLRSSSAPWLLGLLVALVAITVYLTR
jgi:serine/threonine-protein kinase